MVLIHRHRGETTLPEMAGPLVGLVDTFGIAPMNLAQHRTQTIGMGGNCNQMHMIGHQAPRPDLGLELSGIGPEQIKIAGIVSSEKNTCSRRLPR
jgi:hypothetical protein